MPFIIFNLLQCQAQGGIIPLPMNVPVNENIPVNERKYFGTDGIRAVAGEFPLTAQWVMNLGKAAGEVMRLESPNPSVVIGKDTRQSGDMLEAALAAGLTSRGVTVIHLGVLPTPGVSFLTRHLEANAGVVISASHNPYQDNGIKFFGENGQKLSDKTECRIEQMLNQLDDLPSITGTDLGGVTNYSEAERLYVHFLRQFAPDLSGKRIVLDCANGAAYRVAPKVFQAAGADVFAVYTTPDGRNINRDCGSTHMTHLEKLVQEGKYDFGIAFDGDADRALFVDSQGRHVHGDHMLLINALARQETAVVGTIMSNMALEVKLKEHNISLERTAVGDRYVHERLHQQNLHLGGEQSGHMLFLDTAPTGDGILTALLTLDGLSTLKWSVDQACDELKMYPQILENVRVADKKATAQHPDVQKAVQKAEQSLNGTGRINLRPSGTESLIRVMVEGPDKEKVQQVAKEVAAVVERCGQTCEQTAKLQST